MSALVPDMFWRLEPRFERKDESGLADGFALVQKFDWERGGADIASTLAHLRAMPECNGRAGGVGFCFGGVLAYLFAATARPDGNGPDAAVSYYGSGVHGMLDLADKIECPIMFHYGNRDPFIPGEQIAQVEAAVAGRPNVSSTATTPATPSPTGTPRPCTTRPRPTRPGAAPSTSSPATSRG